MSHCSPHKRFHAIESANESLINAAAKVTMKESELSDIEQRQCVDAHRAALNIQRILADDADVTTLAEARQRFGKLAAMKSTVISKALFEAVLSAKCDDKCKNHEYTQLSVLPFRGKTAELVVERNDADLMAFWIMRMCASKPHSIMCLLADDCGRTYCPHE